MQPQNTSIEYQRQLKKIACEVDSYIVKTSGALEFFREKIKPLVQRWNEYNTAINARKVTLSKHWELVKKKPKLQDKNVKPSNKGWEWDKFYLHGLNSFGSNPINEMPAKYAKDVMQSIEGYIKRNEAEKQKHATNSNEYQNLEKTIIEQQQDLKDIASEFDSLSQSQKNFAWIKTPPKNIIPNKVYTKFLWYRHVYALEEENERVFACWRPPLIKLPENPLDRLKPTDEEFHSKAREAQNLQSVSNNDEEYERYYVFLSSVHDNCLPEVESIVGDIWPKDLKDNIWGLCDIFFGDKTAFLNAAIKRVKSEALQYGKSDDITVLLSRKFKCLSDWISETTRTQNYIDSGEVNLPQLKVNLLGVEDTILSLPNSLNPELIKNTQNAYKILKKAINNYEIKQNAVVHDKYEGIEKINSNIDSTDIIRLATTLKVKLETCLQAIINNEKHGGQTVLSTTEQNKNDIKIPVEHKSPPMSIKTMAGIWGGDMNDKKLRGMMNSGTVKYIKMNRQTFIFDTRNLSPQALKKIKEM